MKKLLPYVLFLFVAIIVGCSSDNFSGTKISKEEKELLVGKWRLLKIADFSGRTREFSEDEKVFYEFTKDGKVIVQNVSALEDEAFATFLISGTFEYYYEYDSIWTNSEILVLKDRGDFSVGVSEKRLSLIEYDGRLVLFERVE